MIANTADRRWEKVMAQVGHVRVALTTNNLTDVDADFSSAKQILFYDVSGEGVSFVDAAQFEGRPPGARGPGGGSGCSAMDPLDGGTAESMTARFRAVEDCGVLFTRRLTDFAAVRIHGHGTFPVKMDSKRGVEDVVRQLQHLIATNPPRWLRKRLGMGDMARPWRDYRTPLEHSAL